MSDQPQQARQRDAAGRFVAPALTPYVPPAPVTVPIPAPPGPATRASQALAALMAQRPSGVDQATRTALDQRLEEFVAQVADARPEEREALVAYHAQRGAALRGEREPTPAEIRDAVPAILAAAEQMRAALAQEREREQERDRQREHARQFARDQLERDTRARLRAQQVEADERYAREYESRRVAYERQEVGRQRAEYERELARLRQMATAPTERHPEGGEGYNVGYARALADMRLLGFLVSEAREPNLLVRGVQVYHAGGRSLRDLGNGTVGLLSDQERRRLEDQLEAGTTTFNGPVRGPRNLFREQLESMQRDLDRAATARPSWPETAADAAVAAVLAEAPTVPGAEAPRRRVLDMSGVEAEPEPETEEEHVGS